MRWESLPFGEYNLAITLAAREDTRAFAFTNHRRFLVYDTPLKRGEKLSLKFAAALREAYFLKKENYRDNFLEIKTFGDVSCEAQIERTEKRTLYCLGDSTVCDQEAFLKDFTHCCGWGQTLPLFLREEFAVSNHAEQGTNTSDCLSCHLKGVLKQIKTGDKVFVQFGHNDQKREELRPFGQYSKNLREIAARVGDKGARCVLCTPINRFVRTDGRMESGLAEYAAAVRETAEDMKIGCVDLYSFTTSLYKERGDKTEELFSKFDGKLDRTHPSDIGAMLMGKFAAASVSDMK